MIENKNITRRELIKTASTAGICITAASTFSVVIASTSGHAETLGAETGASDSAQYGFLMDTANCVQCGNCALACRNYNGLSDEDPDRREILRYETEDDSRVFVSTSCMHCAKPSCMSVCPAGAISKGEGGVVVVDQSLCIGCKYCYQACPFKVPHYTAQGMDKCDCCLGSGVVLGDSPHCVDACQYQALYYGTAEELQEIAKGKAQRIPGPTEPSCYVM